VSRITLAIVIGISPGVAFAYFDPGTGSLLIQAAIGGLAAITVFWGNLKVYARSLFSKGKVDSSDSGSQLADLADDSTNDE